MTTSGSMSNTSATLLAAGIVCQRRQGRPAGDGCRPDLELGNLGRLDHQVQARRDVHGAAKGLDLRAGEVRQGEFTFYIDPLVTLT